MKSVLQAVLSFNLLLCCLAKPPMDILPKNPNDPISLPDGVQKKVLIIGDHQTHQIKYLFNYFNLTI